MNPMDVVLEAQEKAAEWIEMSKNPFECVVSVLAHKVVEMKNYIDYLERRLRHETARTRRMD